MANVQNQARTLLEIDGITTARQREVLYAIVSAGTIRGASRALSVSQRAIQKAVAGVKKKAARKGWAPESDMDKVSAPGFNVKGTSTLYDSEGNVRAQWVKTKADSAGDPESILDALSGILEPLRGKAPDIPAPARSDPDILSVYPIGDPHIGMYSWGAESGDEGYDLASAEGMMEQSITDLVSRSPRSRQALVVLLGDFFHADSLDSRTRGHGHVLDVSERWTKVMRVGVRIARHIIEQALKHHEIVKVETLVGNHDEHSSVMLALTIEAFFENHPRVEVSTNPGIFRYMRWGDVLIGMAHGHTCKIQSLPGVMAVDRAPDWGETKHRVWLTGHRHHRAIDEFPGVTVETFRSPAPMSLYEAGAGFRSARDLQAIFYHQEVGEIGRNRIDTSGWARRKK